MTLTAPSEADAPSVARPIFLLAFASFVAGATARVADPLLPAIAFDLGVTTGAAAIVVAAFSISYGLLQAFYGPVGDRFGKFRLVTAATFASSLGVFFSAMTHSLEALTIARLVSGATAAAIIPLSMAWIGDTVPYERRQSVLARFMSGQIMGLILGQAAGGILAEWMGWRQVFVVIGALFLLAGLGLVMEMRRPDHLRSQPSGMGLVDGWVQMAGLFRRSWPRTVLITVFLEGVIVFGAYAFVGSELQHRFGIGTGLAGVMLGAFGLGGLAYAWTARTLVARLGEAGLVRLGGLGLALSFVILTVMPTVWLAPVATAIAGLAFYMFHNTLQTNATQMAPEARGAAVSLFAAGFFLGQTVGVAIVGPSFDLHGGRPAMVAAAVFVPLLAVWFTSRLKRRPG